MLSLFLYGVFNESHVGIRESETAFSSEAWQTGQEPPNVAEIRFEAKAFFPLYLSTQKLACVKVDFEGGTYAMSFERGPKRINFWHFQLFCDADNKRLSRSCGSKKYKRLAKHILETKIQRAVCQKRDAKSYADAIHR